MIRALSFIVFGLVLVVVFVSLFLQPNDLKDCPDYPTGVSPCQKVDAVVAISGGDTDARTDEAIRLYKNGWANYLIFSGAALDKTGPSNAAVMKSRAISAGVPASAVVIDETSENTQQNASNTDSLFKNLNIKTAILVTSGYHQRRASMEFNSNESGVSIKNSPVKQDSEWSNMWWTTTRGWYLSATEIVKIAFLKLGGSV